MNTKIARRPIQLIKSSEIRQHISMQEAIDFMEEAFASLSSGKSFVPLRYVSTLAEGQLNLMLKPAAINEQKRASIKIITQKEVGVYKGIPAIVGVVMVLDTETGEVLALMDGEYITALRTGAASGLATKYFARKDVKTLALYGCGAQAVTQLEAVVNVRNIQKAWVFDTAQEKAQNFAERMQKQLGIEVRVAPNNEVLKECDVICTATNSEVPLFQKGHLKTGVHINAIGSFKPNMQELDPEILQQAKIIVDQKEACLKESGDLIRPINAGLFDANHISGELGEYSLGKIEGRKSGEEITVFKSVGVAIQDYVIANRIYEKAIKEGFGQNFNLFD